MEKTFLRRDLISSVKSYEVKSFYHSPSFSFYPFSCIILDATFLASKLPSDF